MNIARRHLEPDGGYRRLRNTSGWWLGQGRRDGVGTGKGGGRSQAPHA